MNDPIKGCDVYKNIGCVHVDGFLCDYPNCSILKEYKMNERIKELMIEAGYAYPEGATRAHELIDLIVRECGVALSPMLRDMVSRGKAYDLIKQHFGVEE